MTIPRIKHELAEAIGLELAEFLMARGLTHAVDSHDELIWGDAVQMVLRRAGECVADQQDGEE